MVENVGGKVLAVLSDDVVGFAQQVFAPENVDEVADGASAAGLHHQFDGSDALDAPVLVEDTAQLLGALDGHIFVVFLDGPPPRLRFEDDKGVVHEEVGQLIVVERVAVDVDARDDFFHVDEVFQPLAQFLVGYQIRLALLAVGFWIKVEFLGVFASSAPTGGLG